MGTLRTVADASGNMVKRIDSDPFGNIINDTEPALEVLFGFAGGLHDRNTALFGLGTGIMTRMWSGGRIEKKLGLMLIFAA